MNIHIGNLAQDATEDGVRQLFSKYGHVKSVKIIIDMATRKSKGFGFVEMPADAEGQKAIKELNGLNFQGKMLSVSVARPRKF